ncbi:MAG: CPBP family intramembrane glutamic endopeptidase [Victivallales bacterium]
MWQALLLLFLCILLMFFLGIASAVFTFIVNLALPASREYHAFVSLFLNSLLMIGCFVPLCMVIFHMTDFSCERTFRLEVVHPAMIISLIVYAAGSSIVLSDVDNLTRWIFPLPHFLEKILDSIYSSRTGAFILMVIMAPIVEELLFRGVILGGFLKNYSKRNAIIFSALLFAFYHLNPYQLAGAFVGGIVLAWIFAETESLLLCIFLHGLLNLAAWTCKFIPLPFSIPGFNAGDPSAKVEFQPVWFDMIGIFLFISGLCLISISMRKYFNSRTAEERLK